ncbi:MAG: hypothetical protein NXI27_20905 [Alphaproteobacteria bacterium]|nr:hypothetical protein [Alphaproteobacteria bacterium]
MAAKGKFDVRLILHWLVPALIFATSFGTSVWLLPQLNLRPGIHPKIQTMPEFGDPGEDAFFVFSGEKELSHPILYYGLGDSIKQARKADIIFVGNSRTQLGLREEPITRAAKKLGLTTFNLAVGHADGARFATDLFRRHDLRPKIVVVNGGPFIFSGNYSRWAQQVVDMGTWNAVKAVIEGTAKWWLSIALHRTLPRIEYFDGRLTSNWIHYRSSQSGWWRNVLEPKYRYDIERGEERDSFPRALEFATEFKQEMDARGTLIVLTTAPYYRVETNHLSWLSERLGMPYILPSFEGLQTADGSHLSPESAARFSSDFFEGFIKLPEVREKLNLNGA